MDKSANFSTHLGRGLLLLGLAVAFPALAVAAEQSHQSIVEHAVQHVRDRADQFPVSPRVEAGRLDSRLRLPRCSAPLETFDSPGGLSPGRSVVGVSCRGSQPWKLYVPVNIVLPAEVLATAHAMRRGDVIGKADLVRREADLGRLRGQYFTDPADVIGQRLKRNLAGNLPLTPAMIDAQRLVKRGAEVTIVSDTGSIEVRMRGKALGQGGRGDRIRVKNTRSGRELTATIIGRGLVKVSP
jgi:flagella basal body P-ring formation protein FlgA